MSTIDPAKLKVVELRSELTARGLDTKGNKPVLVKRLKDALEKELKEELPDTSIADTSTEDLNTSQESIAEDAVQNVPPDEKEEEAKTENVPQSQSELEAEENVENTKENVEDTKEQEDVEVLCPPVEDVKEIKVEAEEINVDPEIKIKGEEIQKGAEELTEVKAEEIEKDPETQVDEEMKEENDEKIEAEETSHIENDDKVVEEDENKKTSESSKEQSTRGEKRRRFSQSPERYQRRRSKTPIVEDEPVLDNEKVYLSWYDSDLHLQVDKKSFLAGKPLHDGAFGYAWAGVRATHGVNSGKVCFEIKVTEELKWDDLVKHSDKKRDGHGSRRDRRNERSSSRNDKNRGRGSNNERSKRSENSGNESKKVEENSNSEATDNKDLVENTEKEESTTNGDNQESKPEGDEIISEKMEINDDPKEKMEIDDPKEEEESKQVEEQESQEEAAPKSVESKDEAELKETLDVDEENKEEEVKEESKEDEENKEAEVKEEESKEDQIKPEEGENKDSETKTEDMEVEETPVQEIPKHIFRVGWSVLSSGLQLGEAEHSYGYESSGKFVSNKEFVDYGVKFGVGDVVGAYMDVDEDTITLIFTHNGQSLGVAKTIPKVELGEDFVLFPHILTRNCSFELNLGGGEEPWTAHPEELLDYLYLEKSEEKVPGPLRPESRSECEVIMMCGLPASGKTFWVKKLVEESPEKRYNVIGNSHLLEKMTVNGNPLKNSYKGRWNVILDRLMKCVNVLVEVAAARRRNFIIDQTNVFPSAQRRKMRLFEGYKRRAVVVVVADEEQTKRRALQEAQDGKDVPDSAILEMKANMNLPRRGDWLEEVSYVELNEEDAKALVQKYNHQGREAGFGPLSNQRNSSYRDNRGHPYRWDHTTSRRDYRGGYRDNRSYANRNNRSRQQSTWQNRRPPPGSWNRDVRRDSRSSNSSRDFRNNNRSVGPRHERSDSRDNRNRTSGSSGGGGGSYNRNSRSQSSRNQVPSWQGNSGSGGGTGNSWQNQGSWNSSQPGMWSQGSWNQGNWGGQSQQWKGNYGQQQQQGGGGSYGQGYNNYPNWNYYGQYAQNWNSQGQPQTIADGAVGTTTEKSNSYGQQYSQDVSWSQQYATPYGQYTQGEPTA